MSITAPPHPNPRAHLVPEYHHTTLLGAADHQLILSDQPIQHPTQDTNTIILIDGQNLRQTLQQHYGNPTIPIHRLAQHIAQGRHILQTLYYTGIHDPHRHPKQHQKTIEQHQEMADHGIQVITLPLQYLRQWALPHNMPQPRVGQSIQIQAHAIEQAHEKGIDTRIALDALQKAILEQPNTIQICSSDKDLSQAAKSIRATTPVRVEAAIFTPPTT